MALERIPQKKNKPTREEILKSYSSDNAEISASKIIEVLNKLKGEIENEIQTLIKKITDQYLHQIIGLSLLGTANIDTLFKRSDVEIKKLYSGFLELGAKENVSKESVSRFYNDHVNEIFKRLKIASTEDDEKLDNEQSNNHIFLKKYLFSFLFLGHMIFTYEMVNSQENPGMLDLFFSSNTELLIPSFDVLKYAAGYGFVTNKTVKLWNDLCLRLEAKCLYEKRVMAKSSGTVMGNELYNSPIAKMLDENISVYEVRNVAENLSATEIKFLAGSKFLDEQEQSTEEKPKQQEESVVFSAITNPPINPLPKLNDPNSPLLVISGVAENFSGSTLKENHSSPSSSSSTKYFSPMHSSEEENRDPLFEPVPEDDDPDKNNECTSLENGNLQLIAESQKREPFHFDPPSNLLLLAPPPINSLVQTKFDSNESIPPLIDATISAQQLSAEKLKSEKEPEKMDNLKEDDFIFVIKVREDDFIPLAIDKFEKKEEVTDEKRIEKLKKLLGGSALTSLQNDAIKSNGEKIKQLVDDYMKKKSGIHAMPHYAAAKKLSEDYPKLSEREKILRFIELKELAFTGKSTRLKPGAMSTILLDAYQILRINHAPKNQNRL